MLRTPPGPVRSSRTAAVTTVLGAALLALVGCSSDGTSPVADGSPATVGVSPSATATPTAGGTGSPAAGPTSGAPPVGSATAAGPTDGAPDSAPPSVVGDSTPQPAGACSAPALTIAEAGREGAAGSVFVTLRLTNTSGTPCTVTGYPTLELLDDQGLPLATSNIKDGGPGETVTLAQGGAASFVVAFSTVGSGGDDCTPAAQLAITLSGTDEPADVPVRDFAPCRGELRVRPVMPAS